MKTVNERDVDRLVKILDYCDKVEDCRHYFDDSYDVFSKNAVYRDAAQMNLFQIGEQANHLSDQCIEEMGDIPWYGIIGLRNRIAHGYDTLESDKIWDIMINDVPALKNKINAFLKEIGEGKWL